MHVTIFNALATFISSFNAKNFLSALLRMWDAAICFVPLLFFLRLRLRFSSFHRNTHTHTHVKSDDSAAAEGSISCLLCLLLAVNVLLFLFFSTCPACLLSCCPVSRVLPSSCLLTPDAFLPALGFYCLFLCLQPPVSWLPSPVYPLSTVSCLLSPDFSLLSPISCLPTPVYPLLSSASCLPSPVYPVYSLLSTLIHSSFFHLPSPFSSAHLLLNGRVRCGYKCLRLCVVIFYLICNCTSYLPTPPHLCPAPPFFFHAKICNFIGLYRFAIAREAKKESSVQKNYIAQSNSV